MQQYLGRWMLFCSSPFFLLSSPFSLLSSPFSLLPTLITFLPTLISLLSTLISLLTTLITLLSTLITLLPTLITLLPTLITLLPTLISLLPTHHPSPYSHRPSPYSHHPSPYSYHPSPYSHHLSLHSHHLSPYSHHPSPYTYHPSPYSHHCFDSRFDAPCVRRVQVGEQEQQLRALLASKSPRNATVQQLRAVIRDSYEALLFLDFRFAVDHDVLYLLWRLHYNRIEEFRAQIRRIRSAPATSKAGSAQDRQPASVSILSRGSPATRRAQARPQNASDGAGERAEASTAASAVAVYRGFLSEAAGFFHELVGKLKARRALLCDRGVADSQSQQGRAGDGDKWRAACQQCLVYLGDLARYRELVVDGDMATRDWSVAAGYYMQAALMLPSTGNPHNQLAVLATYGGSEVAALYRYYRCIACKQPFATGRTNLLVLFDLNANRCNRLGAAGPQAAQGAAQEATGQAQGAQGAQGAPAEALAVTWRNLCSRFVRLNGILFTHASLESFGAVYLAAMNDLERLLAAPPHALQPVLAVGSSACPTLPAAGAEATVVVQMVACLVCTVHAMLAPHHAFPFAPRPASDADDTRSTSAPSSAQLQQQADRLRHAVTLAFEFVGRLLSRCAASPAPLASPLFPAATVFLQWLAAHPHLAARTNDEASGPGGHAGEGGGGGGEDRESAARMFMWGQAVVVLNRLLQEHSRLLPPLLAAHQGGVQGLAGGQGESSGGAVGLWEDVELRGFEPLPHVCSDGPNDAQRDGQLDVDGWQGGTGGAEGQEAVWARGRRAVCAALTLSGWVQGGAGGAAWAPGDGSSGSVLHFSRRHGRFFIASLVADQLPSPPAASAAHPTHVVHGTSAGSAHTAAPGSLATASATPARPAPAFNHHVPAAPLPWGAATMGSAGQGLAGGMAGVEAGGDGQGEEEGEGDGEEVPLWAVEELIGMDSSAEQSEQHMRELSAHTHAAHSERHNGVLPGAAGNGGVEEHEEEEEEMIVFQPWASGAAAAAVPAVLHATAPRATDSVDKPAAGVQAAGGGGRAGVEGGAWQVSHGLLAAGGEGLGGDFLAGLSGAAAPHLSSLPPSSSPSPRSSSPAMHTAPSPNLHPLPASPATTAAADGSLRRVPSGAGVIGQDRHRLAHTHGHGHAPTHGYMEAAAGQPSHPAADLPGLWGAAPLHAAATAPPAPAPSADATAPAGGSAALTALLGAGLSEHELSALLAKAHQLALHPHAPPSAVRGGQYQSGYSQVSGAGAVWPTSLTHTPPPAAAAPNSFFAGPSAAPVAAGQLPFPHLHAQQHPGYEGQQYGGGVQRGMGAVDQVMASSAFSAPSAPPPAGSSAHTGAAPPPMPAMHAAAATPQQQAAAAQASLQPPQAAAAPNSWHWMQHAHHPWGP
ncbi:unnamed protein product [Closterium sp. Naga37s-1]|nr:unnamed protein product [Closterium sp. Naga37s-1]